MRCHELLRSLHELLEPRSYFEIGVNTGRSLTMSRTRSVTPVPVDRHSRRAFLAPFTMDTDREGRQLTEILASLTPSEIDA